MVWRWRTEVNMTDVQLIKDQLSIAEIIGESVTLTQAGNLYRGLCPFHHEKTPSFFVNDQLGYYKCFGCGEAGDVFDFLEKYDGLTFKEALETLAKRANVPITFNQFDPKEKERERILQVLAQATIYYRQNLISNPGSAAARDYLKQRGLQQKTSELFQLGAALNEWEGVTNFLRAEKFTDQEIVAAGLAIAKSTGRIYDRFRNRLMFPLKNHRGQIVGFSGRVLTPTDQEGKYINTPETVVYHKGKMLYGLCELKEQIKKKQELLIVEGEFDLLSSVQAGVDNVVAIKGSALTVDHANLIARFAQKVILALDCDPAGIKATKKAILTLREVGVDLRVAIVDQGQDPDEYARAKPSAWREKVKGAVSVYDFFLTTILAANDSSCLEGQKEILRQAAGFFPLIDNRLEYEYYLKKLATALNQDLEIVRQDLLRWRDFGSNKLLIAKANIQKNTDDSSKTVKKGKKTTKIERLENYLWFLFLQFLAGDNYFAEVEKYLLAVEWQNHALQQLTQYYRKMREHKNQVHLKEFVDSLPADFAGKVLALSLYPPFIKSFAKNELIVEWEQAQREHQQLTSLFQKKKLQQELAALEEKNKLSPEEETRYQEILTQIAGLH